MSTPFATDATARPGPARQPEGAHGGAVLASRKQAARRLTRFGRRKRPAMRTAITKRLS